MTTTKRQAAGQEAQQRPLTPTLGAAPTSQMMTAINTTLGTTMAMMTTYGIHTPMLEAGTAVVGANTMADEIIPGPAVVGLHHLRSQGSGGWRRAPEKSKRPNLSLQGHLLQKRQKPKP